MAQRQLAIQKLVLVRRFANSDSEPCMLLDGLYVGEPSQLALNAYSVLPCRTFILTMPLEQCSFYHTLLGPLTIVITRFPCQEGQHASADKLPLKRLCSTGAFAFYKISLLHKKIPTGAGSLGAARNLEGLQKRGVTHVLNASPIVPCFHRHHFRYKCVPVYDDVDEDISSFFAETNRFIARVRQLTPHCVHAVQTSN